MVYIDNAAWIRSCCRFVLLVLGYMLLWLIFSFVSLPFVFCRFYRSAVSHVSAVGFFSGYRSFPAFCSACVLTIYAILLPFLYTTVHFLFVSAPPLTATTAWILPTGYTGFYILFFICYIGFCSFCSGFSLYIGFFVLCSL